MWSVVSSTNLASPLATHTPFGQPAVRKLFVLALVGEFTPDLELEADHRAGAAGDLRHGRLDPQPEAAIVDAGDLGLDDDRGRRRHVDVGVGRRSVVRPGATVEEDKGPGRRTASVRGRRPRLRLRPSRRSHRSRRSSPPRRRAAGAAQPRRPAGPPGRRGGLVEIEFAVRSAGGWVPSRVLISALMRAVTGALPCLGSLVGMMPPSSATQMLPAHQIFRFRLPVAAAAKTRARAARTKPRRIRGLFMIRSSPPRPTATSPMWGHPQPRTRKVGRRRVLFVEAQGDLQIRLGALQRAAEEVLDRPRRLRTVRRSTPSAAAVEETLRSASK